MLASLNKGIGTSHLFLTVVLDGYRRGVGQYSRLISPPLRTVDTAADQGVTR